MGRTILPTRWLVMIALVLSLAMFSFSATSAHATTVNITVDGNGTGRVFEGIGAISGGGATSRLLIDYPEPYRSQILDYLFKPDYGASLTDLKVEIGGDANATEGSEPSHMHTASDQNYNRGYEWWLMGQAKARNPNIKLEALAWSWPSWVSDSNGTPFTANGITYLINFLKGAQQTHNLTIDYIGIWNEHSYNISWIEQFKSAISAAGLSTKIDAADDCCGSQWNIATDMNKDANLKAAVDAVGAHYPGQQSPAVAQQLGKPLWASEDGPWTGNWGSWLPTALNKNYTDAKITKTIIWNLITSYYDNLPLPDAGLMTANQPWSGAYNVQPAIWMVAQTTQFASPGWQYIDSASADLSGGGSYVTLKSPNHSDYSSIIETMGASAQQTLNFQVTGGLSSGTIHVWRTNATDNFDHIQDITPVNGTYSLTVDPNAIYSLTTTTGQSKGSATGSAPASFPLPYSDNFSSYSSGSLAKYFYDTNGSFEVDPCLGGRGGNCFEQVVTSKPIIWGLRADPNSILGNVQWTGYHVDSDVLLPATGYAAIYGRVASVTSNYVSGYGLHLADNGNWQLVVGSSNGSSSTTLASGTVAMSLNTWHHLTLSFADSTITAGIDGQTVATANDTTYGSGMAAVGSGWNEAQFSNFAITPITTPVTSLDDSIQGSGNNEFNYVGNWGHCGPCGGDTASPALFNGSNSWSSTANDIMTLTFSGTSVAFYGVLAPDHGIGAISLDGGSETSIDFYSPTRSGNQLLWTSPILAAGTHTLKLRVTGTKNASSTGYYVTVDRADVTTASYYKLVNRESGKLLEVYGQSTSNGGLVDQWADNGGSNQQWQLIPVGNGSYKLVNRNSGKVLDVNGGSTMQGAQLQQWADNGGTNQQWQLASAGGGSINIINTNSGLLADDYHHSTADGGAVVQWSANGGPNQQWQLVPTL
jgi:hypothetical protein